MSDSTDEAENFSSKMRPLSEEIDEFGLKLSREQRDELIDENKRLISKLLELPDNWERILLKIKLCSVIKPGVFTGYRGAKKSYSNATLKYDSFFRTLISLDFSKKGNFFKFASKKDKKSIKDAIDVLLKNIYENLQPKKGKAVELEVAIEHARSVVLIITGGVNERAEEAENVRNLEKEAKLFEDSAIKYRSHSFLFLCGIVIILISIIILSFVFIENNEIFNKLFELADKQEVSKSLYFYLSLKILLSSRIIMFVILIAGFFSCIRFYAANNHNAIICDQRVNTLKSFRSLYAASETKDKELVLRKVLDSATVHQPTGFSNLQSDRGGSSESNLLSKIFSSLLRKE